MLGTKTFINSAASNNAQNIQPGPAKLYSVIVMNASAGSRFIRFFNKATAPTMGTDIPVIVIQVDAGKSKEVWLGAIGQDFSLGISLAITGAAPATDNTAVAAGDVQLAIRTKRA